MNDPINPDPPKDSFLNAIYKSNKEILDRLLYVVISAIIAYALHGKLEDVKQISNETKDTATKAAEKADAAADVGRVNLVLNTEQRADYTGKDEHKVLTEAKAAADQLPTTGPAK